MADRVRKVKYCNVTVPARAGQGAAHLGVLRDAGVNMLAFSGFPRSRGKAQLDFVADDLATVRRIARQKGWRLSPAKKAFLVHGGDQVGACHRQLAKLAAKRINVIAADGVSAGNGRFGMIVWVKPKDYARAAKALAAR